MGAVAAALRPSHAPQTAPRLMTEAEAASYLRLPRAAIRRLPCGRVPINGYVRWDRFALDAWLDALGDDLAPPPAPHPAPATEGDADDALNRWLANQGRDARPA